MNKNSTDNKLYIHIKKSIIYIIFIGIILEYILICGISVLLKTLYMNKDTFIWNTLGVYILLITFIILIFLIPGLIFWYYLDDY